MSDERRQKRLAEVLSEVGAAERLEEALRALVFGAIELVRGESGAVRAYDVAGPGRHVAYWARPDGTLEEDAHPDPPTGSVAAELKVGGEARLIWDLWELAPRASEEERAQRWRGARASIAVPIDARGERIGSLHIDHSQAGQFTPADLSVATALAALAGAVIERARQAARLNAKEAATTRQAHLYAAAAALTAQLTAQGVARTVAEHARGGLGAAEAAVVALDPEGRWFEVLHRAGYQEEGAEAAEVMRAWQRFPASVQTPAADAVRTRRPVLLESAEVRLARYPHLAAVRSAAGEGAVAVLPLVVGQRALAVLHVGFAEARPFGGEELSALETFSHLAAQALERARLYEDARDQATVHVQLNAALREAADERERALAALREERQRLQEAFLRAPAALCVLRGPTHMVSLANVAFFTLLGLRDVTGRPFVEGLRSFTERESGRIMEVLDRVYATGVAYHGRAVRLPIVKGSMRLDVICEPTRDSGGAVDGIYVVAIEATSEDRGERRG